MTDKDKALSLEQTLRLALEFIASINPAFTCEAIHHSKKERHVSNEPCPHVAKQKQVYEAIKAALEAKDEPAAWMNKYGACKTSLFRDVEAGAKEEYTIPLYTTPPQRKPLTDEEIQDALEAEFLGCDAKRNWQDDWRVARAIEAKLKEKNGYA